MITTEILLYLMVAFVATLPIMWRGFYVKKNILGVLLAFGVGSLAYFLGKQVPLIGGAVFGIIIGMICASFIKGKSFDAGIKATSKKVLQAAIVLLGFELNLNNVLAVGSQSLLIMAATLTACFITAYFASKALAIPNKVATLVAVGTCICGGSAIAATSPVIEADEEEVTTAISTIFLYNILAVLIFPAIGNMMQMTDMGFGVWAGTAINDTSSVVAAAYTFSDTAGGLATIVKLTRTLLIIPITFSLALYRSKSQKDTEAKFSIAKIFPWFIVYFILTSIINTFEILPLDMTDYIGSLSKYLIVVAMSAIGLSTNFAKLIKNGKKALILGALCWFVIAVTSLLMQGALDML